MSVTLRSFGVLAAVAGAGIAAEANASAFMLREGSAAAIGAALSGRTSGAGDAGDLSYAIHNPAALRHVRGIEVTFGVAGVIPVGEAQAGAAATAVAGALGFDTSDDYNESAVVPSLVVGWRATDELVLGLTVDSPFGLANEYDDDFIGAFDGVRSDLLTLTVTPIVAYDPVPGLTLAAGLAIQYADAELSNLLPTLPPTSPPTFGVGDISGDGFAIGINLGAIFEPTETTTVGVNFQSGFGHELEGRFSDNFLNIGGNDGRAEFDLPAVVSVGLTQEITDDLRVMAEGEWTHWSDFETLRITDQESLFVIDDPQEYDNSFMVAVGAEYDIDERLTIRGGVAYDQTPTSAEFRTVRVPDGDRYWLSAGASYQITDRVGVDFGYTYIIIEDEEVRLRTTAPAALTGAEIDYVDRGVHLIAANLRYAF